MKPQNECTDPKPTAGSSACATGENGVPKKTTAKRVLGVIGNVVLYGFLAFCLVAVLLTATTARDPDGAAEVFGCQMRVVVSPSMEACEATDVSSYKIGSIPLHSLVWIQTVPDEAAERDAWYGKLQVGDVLTFRYVYATQVTITHRIISITPKEDGGYRIELAGDNVNDTTYGEGGGRMIQTIDTSLDGNADTYNYVIGKVTAKSYVLGLVLSALKTPVGIVLCLIVPCFAIILLQIFKIVKLVGADKKEREAERQKQREEAKDSELEELRRRVAELEGRSGTEGEPSATDAAAEPAKSETVETTETNKKNEQTEEQMQ